ncbi:MAG: alkaline phosphatase family protein [Bdellovibrionaceae bacterium]|nr:alkaline phosphatase family protein [Pseudobdellovibrionaceae bacterium]
MKSALLIGLLILAGCASQPAGTSSQANKSASIATDKSQATVSTLSIPRGIDYTTAPEKIAFGSCANQDQPEPIWKSIIETNPDLFLFMGDNIYATGPGQENIAEQYRKLSQIPGYKEAREKIPFLATWDDGDMGTRDGGYDAPTKDAARRAFLDHWIYLRNSLPLNRDGLYHSKIMGGLVTGKRRKKINGPAVHVIVLDTRSFRSPLNKVADPENPEKQLIEPNIDPKATMLGNDQWRWLEDQLEVPADVRIIVSSIQLIPTHHKYEKWSNFPKERDRFFQLLQKTKAKNVVIFSGDRHMASIAKTEVKGWGTLYEVTSSSLNRPTLLPPEESKDYVAPSFQQENFGLATLDLKKKNMLVELKDINGKTVQSVDIKLR